MGGTGGTGRTQVAPVCDTYPCVPRCSHARAQALLLQYFPVLAWLPQYPVRDWLLGDLLSGLSVAIMQLPQGEPPLTSRLSPQPLDGDPDPSRPWPVICEPLPAPASPHPSAKSQKHDPCPCNYGA